MFSLLSAADKDNISAALYNFPQQKHQHIWWPKKSTNFHGEPPNPKLPNPDDVIIDKPPGADGGNIVQTIQVPHGSPGQETRILVDHSSLHVSGGSAVLLTPPDEAPCGGGGPCDVMQVGGTADAGAATAAPEEEAKLKSNAEATLVPTAANKAEATTLAPARGISGGGLKAFVASAGSRKVEVIVTNPPGVAGEGAASEDVVASSDTNAGRGGGPFLITALGLMGFLGYFLWNGLQQLDSGQDSRIPIPSRAESRDVHSPGMPSGRRGAASDRGAGAQERSDGAESPVVRGGPVVRAGEQGRRVCVFFPRVIFSVRIFPGVGLGLYLPRRILRCHAMTAQDAPA